MTESNWGLTRATVDYGAGPALKEVTLTPREGKVIAVAGGDGAGKTTLLRALLGLVALSSGGVRRPHEDEVGYLPASSGGYPDLTVEENLRFAAGAYGVRGDAYRGARDELLARTGLEPARDRLGGNLSGGMRQKLGLAMAMVHRPSLLVLDEPSTGIDPVSRRDLWQLVTDAARSGAAVLMTTTYLDEAGRCDWVSVLDEGEVLLQGPPAELVGGIGGSVEEGAKRPGSGFAWRRGASWRIWTPEGFTSDAVRVVTPDLQDAVVVAALRKREATEVSA
ncbi:MAG: ABC transporter ATP-binding protein [Actinomycetota bacterium]